MGSNQNIEKSHIIEISKQKVHDGNWELEVDNRKKKIEEVERIRRGTEEFSWRINKKCLLISVE